MTRPPDHEPENHFKNPPPQTIILESTPSITSFQRQDRTVRAPRPSSFQLLEPMPAETAQKSWPMFFLGFFMPFIVCFLIIFGTHPKLLEVLCWALPLLYIGTLIYSFSKGSRSFGKGLLAALVATVLFIGGFILIIYIEYGM